MSFNPRIAFRNIAGFERDTTDTRQWSTSPLRVELSARHTRSGGDIELYGGKFQLVAHIRTTYEPAKQKGKRAEHITDQSAFVRLISLNSYEGYEAMPRSMMIAEGDGQIDLAKGAHSKKLLAALQKQIPGSELSGRGNAAELRIPIDHHTHNPVQEISRITAQIEGIAAAYQAGNKPLGDIAVPHWDIRANPAAREHGDIVRMVDERTHAGIVPDDGDDGPARRKVSKINQLARAHFPHDKKVTETNHEQFFNALLQLMDITAEQYAAPKHTGRSDSAHINYARITVDDIMKAARTEFEVGEKVGLADREMFRRRVDRVYDIERGTTPGSL